MVLVYITLSKLWLLFLFGVIISQGIVFSNRFLFWTSSPKTHYLMEGVQIFSRFFYFVVLDWQRRDDILKLMSGRKSGNRQYPYCFDQVATIGQAAFGLSDHTSMSRRPSREAQLRVEGFTCRKCSPWSVLSQSQLPGCILSRKLYSLEDWEVGLRMDSKIAKLPCLASEIRAKEAVSTPGLLHPWHWDSAGHQALSSISMCYMDERMNCFPGK